jgi:outer membrane protein assembly factor BamB
VASGGNIVYLGVTEQGDPVLVALDPATGEVVWHRPSDLGNHIGGVEERLVVDGNNVFHLESGGGSAQSNVAFKPEAARAQADAADVVAVNAVDGSVVWRHPADADTFTPLDNCDGALCAQSGEIGEHLTITRLAGFR